MQPQSYLSNDTNVGMATKKNSYNYKTKTTAATVNYNYVAHNHSLQSLDIKII